MPVNIDSELTPCLEPKYAPIADRGAEIPNQRSTISSMVPKGTAPEEPAMSSDKLSKKTIANIKLRV